MPELYEKYSWFRDDFKYAGPNGSKAQFKGVALLPVVSGNGKKYVEEELHRSARTLVGKRVDLNHNSQKVKGNVSWAEFEDSRIEYVMEIHDKEYVEKLRDRERLSKESYVKKWGRDPIYGVSVEANYRYHDEQCRGGRCTVEPHGIIFNALSIVEDPERPGVQGTTIEEIRETQTRQEQSIIETLVKDLVPSSVIKEETNMSKPPNPPDKEKPCDCPPGQHDNGAGECVPDSEDDQSMETLELKHRLDKIELRHSRESRVVAEALGKTRSDLTAKIAEVDVQRQQCCTRLGETQKQLLETEAIAKGAFSKLEEKAQTSDVAALKTSLEMMSKTLTEKVDHLASKEALAETAKNILDPKPLIAEALSKLPKFEDQIKPINEALSKIPAAYNDKPLTDKLTAFETRLAESDKKYATLNTVYEALDKKHAAFVAEVNSQKLKETQDSQSKLMEMQKTLEEKDKTLKTLQEQIDTLKLHVPARFKATLEEKKQEPNFSAPYTYGK